MPIPETIDIPAPPRALIANLMLATAWAILVGVAGQCVFAAFVPLEAAQYWACHVRLGVGIGCLLVLLTRLAFLSGEHRTVRAWLLGACVLYALQIGLGSIVSAHDASPVQLLLLFNDGLIFALVLVARTKIARQPAARRIPR
jgi:heme A synthase